MKRIARVFPRRTKATPDDELTFVGLSPRLALPEIDEIHVSVAFTWDIPKAELLVKEWELVGVPVKLGGPAYNEPGDDFIPGMYIKKGYVITSRGCPNNCWFCAVPKREGREIRELPVTDGHNILDDNLLACSDTHINAVFDMLLRQKERPIFSGGLEAARLKPWHVERLVSVKTRRMYFAYDTPDDYEPLFEAGKMLKEAGYKLGNGQVHTYVLIGYPGDTTGKALERLIDTAKAGFAPFAMLYRNDKGVAETAWSKFQRTWTRPHAVFSELRRLGVDV